MEAATLHALQILTQSLVQEVGIFLAGLPILDVTLPIQHPRWNLELQRIANHCYDLVDLISRQLSSPLVHVNV